MLPNWAPVHHRVPARLVSTILGRKLNENELANAMIRMGGSYLGRSPATSEEISDNESMQYAGAGEDMLGFDMPRWRFDLLHPVDIVEDLAIGHGYEDLGSDVPKAPMNAIPRSDDHLRRRIRTRCKVWASCRFNRSRCPMISTNSNECVGNRSMPLLESPIQSRKTIP